MYSIDAIDLQTGHRTTLASASNRVEAHASRIALQDVMIRLGSYVDIEVRWVPRPQQA